MDTEGTVMRLISMKERMEKKEAEIHAKVYIASAGGGMVTIVMKGNMMVQDIIIDPKMEDDFELLPDVITAAFRAVVLLVQKDVEVAMRSIV